MKVMLQATGFGPTKLTARHVYKSKQMLAGDKRGVEITLCEGCTNDDDDDSWPSLMWVADVTYLTSWGSELQFTRVSWADDLPTIEDGIREDAKTMLPPGAGYPAMPQFETRQAKLQGMLETLTLVALSDVLRQVSESAPGGT